MLHVYTRRIMLVLGAILLLAGVGFALLRM